jgi:hypothetical protein
MSQRWGLVCVGLDIGDIVEEGDRGDFQGDRDSGENWLER